MELELRISNAPEGDPMAAVKAVFARCAKRPGAEFMQYLTIHEVMKLEPWEE